MRGKTVGAEKDREEKLTKLSHTEAGVKEKLHIKDLPNAPLMLEDCVLSEPNRVSMYSV